MKHTKLVALTTALTLALAPTSAFATELEIGGDTNYVNKTIYQFTLPTSEGMSFTLDPQGLASLDSGDYDANEAGKILANGGSMEIVNESSVDVTLEASFYIVDSKGEITLSDTDISDETAAELALVITANDGSSDTSVPVTSSDKDQPSSEEFTMTAADYTFTGTKEDGYDYELTADSGSTLTMTIGGKVAKEYEWDSYVADDAAITLHAVFKFTDADGEEIVTKVDPVEAVNSWESDTYIWVSIADDGGITDESKISSVQVLASDASFADVTYDYTDTEGGWIGLAWDDMVSAGLDDSGSSLTIQFTYDGTLYETTATW